MSSGNCFGIGPGLRLFVRKFHFDHHIQMFTDGVQAACELRRVHSLDHMKQLGRRLRFVRLQMSDQMEASIRHRPELGRFLRKLLDIVLAKITQTDIVCFAYNRSREDLRHCY